MSIEEMIKTCRTCGMPFMARDPKAVYCSEGCRHQEEVIRRRLFLQERAEKAGLIRP